MVAVFDDQTSSCELAQSIFPGADVGLVDTWLVEPPADASFAHIRDFRLL